MHVDKRIYFMTVFGKVANISLIVPPMSFYLVLRCNDRLRKECKCNF